MVTKRLAFLRKGRDHAGDPASHDPVGDTRAAHALKKRPIGRRVEVLLEVYAASGDQLQEYGVCTLLRNHVGRHDDRAAWARDPLELLECVARFRQQVNDVGSNDRIEGVVRVAQVGDIRLFDDHVRVARELLPGLLEHPLGVVGRDHTRTYGSDGCGDRARAARTFEHGVAGANQPGNGAACPVVHPPVERVDGEVVERGNPIPDHIVPPLSNEVTGQLKPNDTRVPETFEVTARHLPEAPPEQDPPLWPLILPDS